MNVNEILNFYEEVKDDLEFQSMQNIQIKIMISLSDGPKKIKDLQKSIGISSFTILNEINELEKQNLVSSGGNYYYLSKIGKETASRLTDMVRTFIVLRNNRELWLNHEIDAIPHELLMEIGDLSNSEFIETENLNIGKIHEIHTQIVLNSKEIRGVSPIFYSDYTKTFMGILKKGVKVELILTDAVVRKTLESLDNIKDLDEFISAENLTIWKLNEDVKIAFTVTDKSMTLGLFSKEGKYDSTKILVSDHEDALAWSNRLFDYYLKKAQKVNLEDLKIYEKSKVSIINDF